MKKESVLKLIKKKFGSMSEFCRAAGLDRYEFQKAWNNRSGPSGDFLEEIASLCASTDQTGMVHKAEIKRISKLIEDAGGVTKFCNDNPSFHRVTVSQILKGNRTRGSKVFEDLVDFFKEKK